MSYIIIAIYVWEVLINEFTSSFKNINQLAALGIMQNVKR